MFGDLNAALQVIFPDFVIEYSASHLYLRIHVFEYMFCHCNVSLQDLSTDKFMFIYENLPIFLFIPSCNI